MTRRILLSRLRALGDTIHTLPVVSDIHAALGKEAVVDVVVEEAHAIFPRMHPGVNKVIVMASRRWRKSPSTNTAKECLRYLVDLRSERYDAIMDFHGRINTAVLSGLLARGPTHGPCPDCAHHPWSSRLYRNNHPLPMGQSNLIRNRVLAAQTLNYPKPDSLPDYGIGSKNQAGTREAVLLVSHASKVSKLWRSDEWVKLGRAFVTDGLAVELTWGNASERNRAEKIATACGGSVASYYNGQDLLDYVARFKGIVSLDTGLAHIGALLGVPGVTLFANTSVVTQWQPYGPQQLSITISDLVDSSYVHSRLLALLNQTKLDNNESLKT